MAGAQIRSARSAPRVGAVSRPVRRLVRMTALGAAVALATLAPRAATAQLNLYSTLEVDTTSAALDWTDGACSLREAITNVNNHDQGGAVLGECEAADGSIGSKIVFDTKVFGSGAAILLNTHSGPLPYITANFTTVDGWSAGGVGYTGPPLVTLDGSGLAGSATRVQGLKLESSSSTVRGLSMVNFATPSDPASIGIWVDGGYARIYGNFVGIEPDGTTAAGNDTGIYLGSYSIGSIVGTNGDGVDDDAERNVVSGNLDNGVTAEVGTIAGNYIGTDAGGLVAIGNRVGVEAYGATVVGGDTSAEGNVIAGSQDYGVYCFQSADETLLIRHNLIGTDRTGLAPLPNNRGILIRGMSATLGSGFATIRGNVVAGNSLHGVAIQSSGCNPLPCSSLTGNHRILDNLVGLGADGTTVVGNGTGIVLQDSPGNLIRGNYVSGNTDYGIDLTGPTTTGNSIESNLVGLDTDHHAAFQQSVGIAVVQAPGNTIRGNTLTGSATQLMISGVDAAAEADIVTDNRIGTAPDGSYVSSFDAGVEVNASSSTLLRHNTIEYCYRAVDLLDGAEVGLDGNLVTQNLSGGDTALALEGTATVASATDNCIEDNSIGVTNSTGATVVLESTWWGDASGPSGAGPGTGDSVSADVDFDPWLTTRPDCGVRLLFLDDFESADTHYWSSTTP